MSKMKEYFTNVNACNEPEVGSMVYNYYNGALSVDQVPRFEVHLIKCRYCEQVVVELDKMLTILNERSAKNSDVEFRLRPVVYRPPSAIK
ncbi:MAG: hypothetical protein IPG76_09995 [Acidobacteria bacterium]|nr:hypothetical protein [Acidobacteriota bacterium]